MASTKVAVDSEVAEPIASKACPTTAKSTLSACTHEEGHTAICEDALRERAFLKWEAAGYPPGDGVNFWLEAEAELKAEASE